MIVSLLVRLAVATAGADRIAAAPRAAEDINFRRDAEEVVIGGILMKKWDANITAVGTSQREGSR
jgi:hypothetical protein